MAKSLVIVESPAKARTLKKYLGKGYQVLASVGHIKDLPKSKLGVEVEKNFEPTYEVIRGKGKVLKEIKEAAKKAEEVFLAPDPDREGEAIAWHLAEEIRGKKKGRGPKIRRALFHEITKSAVLEAIRNPTDLNPSLYEAQQARRILDRLVGYKISPILWDKVRRGLSAGRVQSVAVRILCEREEAIEKFEPKEYWSLTARLEGNTPPVFEARLIGTAQEGAWPNDPKKGEIPIPDKKKAESLLKALEGADYVLADVAKRERKKYAPAPFITSQIQQDASRKLGFSAKKTMMLAQRLYEGIELGEEGPVGLITYMRTDSVRVSDQALQAVRVFIGKNYGKELLPESPNVFRGKKGAQDAHEAIRPTDVGRTPDRLKDFLERDLFRLYDLIWKRFTASQMIPAVYDQTSFDIHAAEYLFRASGSVLRVPGFMSVYMEAADEDIKEEEEGTLPDLQKGDRLDLKELLPKQHFTEPPPRYTEASLVKTLEELGIGRPSTYAQILSNIVAREYVTHLEKRFQPTSLGRLVNTLLVEHFPRVLNVQFTAQMEQELDEVEEGKRAWVEALNDFYHPFKETLAKAEVEMKNLKQMQIETEHSCEACGAKLVVRWGRHGEFLACSNYPECKVTHEFNRDEKGKIHIREKKDYGPCEKCSAPLLLKRGKFGPFLACSAYPECKFTKAIPVGVPCPKCGADLVARRTRRGRTFYGCQAYPKCDYAVWQRPMPVPCPQCEHPFLVEKTTKMKGTLLACPNKECGYEGEAEE